MLGPEAMAKDGPTWEEVGQGIDRLNNMIADELAGKAANSNESGLEDLEDGVSGAEMLAATDGEVRSLCCEPQDRIETPFLLR